MFYHMVMARKEVLVQLEDDLVKALDQIAKERGTNRSERLRTAARVIVTADDEAKADAELIAAYTAVPQDPQETEAMLRIALEVWPDY